jgi:2-polyprenyl-6-methoxyphenol hydroxylase-like FAD-dependent oxidoreductase
MSEQERWDVVIVGGGWVGMVAAAALANERRRVLVLEARPGTDPRFRGELIHAGGVRVLRELGLAGALERGGAFAAKGFAVVTGRRGEMLTLEYPEGEGLAMDHHAMVHALRREASARENVTVRTGQRVTDVVREGDRVVGVQLADGRVVRARLTVVADGRHSRLRPLLGLDGTAKLLSFTAAVRVDGVSLPKVGHGTVVVSPLGPILAYEVGHEQVRMCVDIPSERAKGTRKDLTALLLGEYAPHVPEPLRSAMVRAIEAGQVELCANQAISTDRVAVKGAVLLGDSAGCSHPLSAGGMTVGAQDALSLRTALDRAGDDRWDEALLEHEKTRYRGSRGREVLAQALYDVFLGATPGARALREGMYRYWRSSERARVASMALLSGDETRVSSFAREYVTVMGFALSAVRDEGRGLALREAMATRWGVWTSAWDVAREPLARSGRFTWVEALRNLGRRPAAEVPSMSNAGEGAGAPKRAGAEIPAASAPGRNSDEGSGR